MGGSCLDDSWKGGARGASGSWLVKSGVAVLVMWADDVRSDHVRG